MGYGTIHLLTGVGVGVCVWGGGIFRGGGQEKILLCKGGGGSLYKK